MMNNKTVYLCPNCNIYWYRDDHAKVVKLSSWKGKYNRLPCDQGLHQQQIAEIRKMIKTKEIKNVYDRDDLEAHHQLVLADEIYQFLSWKPGLNLSLLLNYDFGYTIADHHHRQGYYIFAIADQKIIKTKWAKRRKDIGAILQRYAFCHLIVFYPISERFQYYLSQLHNQWPNTPEKTIRNPYLYEPIRVDEPTFIAKMKTKPGDEKIVNAQ